MNASMDVTSYLNKLPLIWQEMNMCREIVWNYPSDGIQHSRLEELDRIYDFLVGLDSKLDVVRGRILGQKPISS